MPESKSGALTSLATPQMFRRTCEPSAASKTQCGESRPSVMGQGTGSIKPFTQRVPIQPFCHKSLHSARTLPKHLLCRLLRIEGGKHTGSGPRHCRRPKPPQPFHMPRHFGVPPAYDRFKIVATRPRRKAQYFDWTRIPCQFRVAKHRSRGYRHGRYQDNVPGWIQGNLL